MTRKTKAITAILMAAILALGTITVFALDYEVPENAAEVTARFTVVTDEELDQVGDEFDMVSDCGEMTISVDAYTLIYFEDYVPLSDECDGMTQMAREVLFGRTMAEVLNNRNLRVLYIVNGDEHEVVSIKILFETAIHLPIDIENGYIGIMPLPEYIDVEEVYFGLLLPPPITPVFETDDEGYIPIVTLPTEIEYFGAPPLIGEIVVNGEILKDTPAPFWCNENGVVMIPLRVVATALEFDLAWNGDLQSIQIGVARHIWIGSTEAHVGRMAPLELSAAPVLIDGITFVPLDFFQLVLAQTAYVFEGQVIVESESDMY